MWTNAKAWEWYRSHPWIVGFNYVPSSAINSTEMWQTESFDEECIRKELALAGNIGFNAVRIFLPFLVWKHERDGFMGNLEAFLQIAWENGMRTVPILFDDCAFSNLEPYLGPQKPPVPGIHNSGWTPSPGFHIVDDPAYWEDLRQYVTEILTTYGNDDRILFWDLYNEPGNSERKMKCLPLLRQTFAWAREAAPSQPLTACVWAWEAFDLECASLSDVVTFHDYSPVETTRKRVEGLRSFDRPLFCTEWLHREAGCTFESHLPYYAEENIGIFQWGLVTGKTQTYLNWEPEKNPQEGMPEIWQHDIFDKDFSPYRPEEILLLQNTLKRSRKKA